MIEYKVRPVTRYVVTRYEQEDVGAKGTSEVKGEFDNASTAYEVGYALCKEEHIRSGKAIGHEDFRYPENPDKLILGEKYVR